MLPLRPEQPGLSEETPEGPRSTALPPGAGAASRGALCVGFTIVAHGWGGPGHYLPESAFAPLGGVPPRATLNLGSGVAALPAEEAMPKTPAGIHPSPPAPRTWGVTSPGLEGRILATVGRGFQLPPGDSWSPAPWESAGSCRGAAGAHGHLLYATGSALSRSKEVGTSHGQLPWHRQPVFKPAAPILRPAQHCRAHLLDT